MHNVKGQITFSKSGATIVEGNAIEAFRVHNLWMIVGLWARGLRDRSIQGITQKRALELAGEMTGKKYKSKNWSAARTDLEARWQASNVVRED